MKKNVKKAKVTSNEDQQPVSEMQFVKSKMNAMNYIYKRVQKTMAAMEYKKASFENTIKKRSKSVINAKVATKKQFVTKQKITKIRQTFAVRNTIGIASLLTPVQVSWRTTWKSENALHTLAIKKPDIRFPKQPKQSTLKTRQGTARDTFLSELETNVFWNEIQYNQQQQHDTPWLSVKNTLCWSNTLASRLQKPKIAKKVSRATAYRSKTLRYWERRFKTDKWKELNTENSHKRKRQK